MALYISVLYRPLDAVMDALLQIANCDPRLTVKYDFGVVYQVSLRRPVNKNLPRG